MNILHPVAIQTVNDYKFNIINLRENEDQNTEIKESYFLLYDYFY